MSGIVNGKESEWRERESGERVWKRGGWKEGRVRGGNRKKIE